MLANHGHLHPLRLTTAGRWSWGARRGEHFDKLSASSPCHSASPQPVIPKRSEASGDAGAATDQTIEILSSQAPQNNRGTGLQRPMAVVGRVYGRKISRPNQGEERLFDSLRTGLRDSRLRGNDGLRAGMTGWARG